MEAVNHCLLTGKELKAFISKKELSGKIIVPDDGPSYSF